METQENIVEQEKKRKNRKKLYEFRMEDDIKYRGPLSRRAFLILGWLCIVLSQVAVVMNLGSRLDESIKAQYGTIANVFSVVSNLSVPFILIANYSKILSSEKNYFRYLFQYGALSLVVIGLSFAVYFRYISGTVMIIIEDRAIADSVLANIGSAIFNGGFLAYNIFIDLFQCTFFLFALNYHPRRFFTGKKVVFIRCLAVFPVIYEVACLALKIMSSNGIITLPIWTYPMLSTRSTLVFFLFVALSIFIKTRERFFRQNGRTHEEFQVFLTSNKNSLQFSVFLLIAIFIVGFLDTFILTTVSFIFEHSGMDALDIASKLQLYGIGQSLTLLPLTPFIMLFSYNRKPRLESVDRVIPVVALGLIGFVYIEGIYQAILGFKDLIQTIFANMMIGS